MLKTFFQDPSQKVFLKYKPQVDAINALEEKFKLFSDAELKTKTSELKMRLLNGESKAKIIPEAFALVREASSRVLGLRHFDVQLIGGLVLDEGQIAEMKTGEGKTLVALLPTFLNALYGKGTHVITANDYLARRDVNSVGQVHSFLGLTVGLIQEEMESVEKKKNYNCDVVYVTNSTLGFDYLRDNMAYDSEDVVQRSFFYCVVDEVDSILIDEARTPLIISSPGETSTEKYLYTKKLATTLKSRIHYLTDEKRQNVTLTNDGVTFCEKALKTVDLYNPEEPWIFYILNSLKAKEFYKKNINYIVNENDEIIIVDEFTGRTMPGRRWSGGIHQSVEAKENLPIQEETKTIASITYQNLFLLYEQLSGMTGTAQSEDAEFEKIYNLRVLTIPTNRPIIRNDLPDIIYKSQYVKWRSIAQECFEMHNLGRPVLVGTATIEKSELLAALLDEYKIPYRLLNARAENVANEAEIVAQAGCKAAITIATNMAGRGTDILLGGNPNFLTNSILREVFSETDPVKISQLLVDFNLSNVGLYKALQEKYIQFLKLSLSEIEKQYLDPTALLFVKVYNAIFAQQKEIVEKSRQTVLNLGGLHVIGSEHHESRRIDNQLRGRAGRQGDPGSSHFFLCFEDKLLRIFGGEQLVQLMEEFGFPDDTPIQSELLTKSLNYAQTKIEAFYFETRKELFEYDQPINVQRNSVYAERRNIFEQKSARRWLIECAEQSLIDLYEKQITDAQDLLPKDRIKFIRNQKKVIFSSVKLQNLLGVPFPGYTFPAQGAVQDREFLQQQIEITYDLKELEMELIEVGAFGEVEKLFILQEIDVAWTAHLQKIGFLKGSISWIAYGQKNPLTEYKKEALNYFNIMLAQIRHRIVYFVLRSGTILW
jgi:preprotein translocase subunit SecA